MSEQTRPEAAKNLWPSLKRLLGDGRCHCDAVADSDC